MQTLAKYYESYSATLALWTMNSTDLKNVSQIRFMSHGIEFTFIDNSAGIFNPGSVKFVAYKK